MKTTNSKPIRLGANQAMCLEAIRREGQWPGGWSLDNPSTTVRVLDSLVRIGLVRKNSAERIDRRAGRRETFTVYNPARSVCIKCPRNLHEEAGDVCAWCLRAARAAGGGGVSAAKTEKTIGDDRACITHGPDFTDIRRYKRDGRGRAFSHVETVSIPQAHVDFARDALAIPNTDDFATVLPKFIRVARRCPRCRGHHYHLVEHADPVPARAQIICSACGHRWRGSIKRDERGLED